MPLMWFGPGSAGEGPERYSLRLPCELSPDRNLKLPDEGVEVAGDRFTVRLLKEDPGFRVVAEPFDSPDAAEQAWPILRASLLRTALICRAGIRTPRYVERARQYDEPRPIPEDSPVAPLTGKRGWQQIDGDYDAVKVSVVPEHKRLIRAGAGTARVVKGLEAEEMARLIWAGLTLPAVSRLTSNEKLQLGVELYISAFFASSQRARLLRLVTVLDAIAVPQETPPVAVEAWQVALDAVASLLDSEGWGEDSPEAADVQRLLQRMRSFRIEEESISHAIRELIGEAERRDEDLGELDELRKKSMTAYGVRSKLLHDGQAPDDEIADASEFLRGFVPRLLLSLIDHPEQV